MSNQVQKVERITIAEALRRVRDAISRNMEPNRFPNLESLCTSTTMRPVGSDAESGMTMGQVKFIPPPAFIKIEEAGKARAIREIPESFRAFCAANNVVPRSLLNPWGAPPYVGGVSSFEDSSYDIAISEYELWAAPYFQSTIPRRAGGSANARDTPPAASGAVASLPDSDVPWTEIAVKQANIIYATALAAGYELKPAQIAEKLAPLLKQMGVSGARGYLTPANIERMALRRWTPPKA